MVVVLTLISENNDFLARGVPPLHIKRLSQRSTLVNQTLVRRIAVSHTGQPWFYRRFALSGSIPAAFCSCRTEDCRLPAIVLVVSNVKICFVILIVCFGL